AVAVLRSQLLALGDSVVIVGSGIASDPVLGSPDRLPVWNVHVHVNDVGAAIEAGVRAGRPHRISVTRFADEAAPTGPTAREPGARGLVVVASGPGLAKIFEEEGAVVVTSGPGTSPSTRDLLQAIQATGAGLVAVLPNDPDVLAVAQAAAEQARAAGIDVGVVPTKSPVQAMAAIAVRDPDRHFHDDMIAMRSE